MSVIQDLSGNPLITQSSPMVGFQPVSATSDALGLSIYRFIIEGIRTEDQINGGRLLERFLQGPQEVWAQTTQAIVDVKTLWDLSTIDDRFLPFLKRIVGWTPDLDEITTPLDSLTLRRLIKASVPFWKRRGPEDAIEDILRLVTTARLRIMNWFDIRVVTEETEWGEEWNGYDPWFDDNDSEYNIRIVDDGTLNRQLVRQLARLTRPGGETVVIDYLGFLDQFSTPNDKSQWVDEGNPLGLGGGASMSEVSNGFMALANGGHHEETYVAVPGATSWSGYAATWCIRGENHRCIFYRTGAADFYDVVVNATGIIALRKFVAGVETTLATFELATFLVVLNSDWYNTIRVVVFPEGSSTRIKAYFNALPVANVLDSSHTAGTIGIGHKDGADDFIELNLVELFFVPHESDTININS